MSTAPIPRGVVIAEPGGLSPAGLRIRKPATSTSAATTATAAMAMIRCDLVEDMLRRWRTASRRAHGRKSSGPCRKPRLLSGLRAGLALEGRHGGREGVEDVVGTHAVEEPGGLEVGAQILFHAGERQDDAACFELLAKRVEGIDGGDVDLDIGLGVQQQPANRGARGVDGGEGAAPEVFGVG